MPKQHQVQPGECISSIAFDNGFFPDTLWNLSANAGLRNKRKDPNVLSPGDVVVIPEKREKTETIGTGSEHRFRLRGVPALFRLQMFDENEKPMSNQSFTIVIDGNLRRSGTTDSQGVLSVPLPPKAGAAVLTIGPEQAEFHLEFGRLQPITEIAGVQARLNNIGFGGGEVTGVLDDPTREALQAFQLRFGLPESGEPDAATLQRLEAFQDGVCDFPKAPEESQ